MRAFMLLMLFASPALAWDFSPLPVCTLSGGTDALDVTVTYDPRSPEPYTITLTRDAPWPSAPVFALRFEGPRGLTIRTPRHLLSDDRRSLSVTDSGFGNVLDGMEFNIGAAALIGDAAERFSLDGAADPTRAFRDCTKAPLA